MKELQNQSTEMKYQVLRKRQVEEVEKRRYSEKACEGLREDVEKAKCVTVDLLSRLEACRTAYNAELLRVDALTAASVKKKQEYEIKLAVKAKKLVEYEVETHKWLLLRELEHHAAKMVAGSVRRQRRLAKKLDALLSRSSDAVVNLELELASILQRLGLDQKLEEVATTNSAK
ncbi:hypothetical protein AXG93_4525s1030 [Marchantia polymorpha subsp. ruderalis]|uniref:Uncharacterized protein n=1 Tax=Marchantia polymorpha subsp. ruderalis TaxID=1480154 RepID=A0A176WIQ0_MARPO|nr:hypothetical protein AXG93_4525s1030 [Marchantia polymorpha subsp. ruderalis]